MVRFDGVDVKKCLPGPACSERCTLSEYIKGLESWDAGRWGKPKTLNPKPQIESFYYGILSPILNPTSCRNLIQKPWVFIRVPYMNPTIWGVMGPGFLNQVPTLCSSTF